MKYSITVRAWGVASALLLGACASNTPAPIIDRTPPARPGAATPAPGVPSVALPRTDRPEFYAARPSDTVRSIARDQGMEPREIIELLNREVNAAIDKPELKATVAKLGLEVMGGPPERLGERIEKETAVWRQVAEKAKVRID